MSDGFLTDNLGTHWYVNGEPIGASRRIDYQGSPDAIEYEIRIDPITKLEYSVMKFTPLASGGIGGTPDVTITGRDLIANLTRDVAIIAVRDAALQGGATGVVNVGTSDAPATNVGREGGLTTIRGVPVPTENDMPANKAYVDGIGGFNSQAENPNVATTAVTAGTTTVSSRAGQNTDIGNSTGAIAFVASQYTVSLPAAAGAYAVATSAAINFGATTNLRMGVLATSGSVWIGTADDGVHQAAALIQIGDLPASGTHLVNLHGRVIAIQSVLGTTIDGIRADYERVTKASAATLEAGKLNELTSGTTWTLPALSGVADGESVYVVHPWATSDGASISRAGSDVINGGDGHAADTSFDLKESQGLVRFWKVNGEWRVMTQGNANAPPGGGGGASVTDTTGTFGFLGPAGQLTGTGLTHFAVSVPAGAIALTGDGAYLGLAGATGEMELTADAGIFAVTLTGGQHTRRFGGSTAGVKESLPGPHHRTEWYDAGNALGLTLDVDNTAVALTAVGTLTVEVQSASVVRSVTATTHRVSTFSPDGSTELRVDVDDVDGSGSLIDALGGALVIREQAGHGLQIVGGYSVQLFGNGPCTVGGGLRTGILVGSLHRVDYTYFATGVTFRTDWLFAAVEPAGAGATSLGPFDVPANSSGRFEGTVSVSSVASPAANSAEYAIAFNWNADGTDIFTRDLTATLIGTEQGTIGLTPATDFAFAAASGLGREVTVTNAGGLRLVLVGSSRINAR